MLHLQKLCVGADGPENLFEWQESRPDVECDAGAGPIHVTRSRPKRAAELLAGGSLYWVMRGAILCRQRILGLLERRGADGLTRCAIVLDRGLVRTAPAPRRAFQGWRYLEAEEAPADAGRFDPADGLPDSLRRALAEVGVV